MTVQTRQLPKGVRSFVAAQPRDVDARRVGGLEDRLARLGLDLDAVDREGDRVAHRRILSLTLRKCTDSRPAIASASLSAAWMSNDGWKPSSCFASTSAS